MERLTVDEMLECLGEYADHESAKQLIALLEELQQYRAIGTPEECRAAVKQKAKKPVTYKGTNRAECPICGATVRGISKPFGDWCSNCGQKLDWSDEE